MGKQISLIILLIIMGLAIMSLGEQAVAMDFEGGLPEIRNAKISIPNGDPVAETEKNVSCSASNIERPQACREMEQQILAMTLRIEIQTWLMHVADKGYMSFSGNGHGTVMAGRYLVTHNHFELPLLDLLEDRQQSELATVTLFTSAGQQLWHGPLTAMKVTFADSETLLLEFQDQNGRGLFETLGVPSANFNVLPPSPIPPGKEVAQVNWDETQAHVQWTKVEAIIEEGNTPIVKMSGCIVLGASGGGIFWDGTHIANNWFRSFGCAESPNNKTQHHTTGALNSVQLLAAVNQ